MEVDLDLAVDLLSRANSILVYTGAGISTESGIPDFRGPDGLWTKVDPDDFTIQRWLTNRDIRVRGWQMHQRGELWGARSAVLPNRAHEAVTELWRMGLLAGCVTQNVDGLHQAAGLPDATVAEVHGNIRKARCIGCGQSWATEDVLEWIDAGEEDPHCPECTSLVKTTTVMFGELLPASEMEKAEAFAARADAVLAVGTTLSVYPAAEVPLGAARRGAPMVIVNMGGTDHDYLATVKVEGKAGEVLPALVRELGRRI